MSDLDELVKQRNILRNKRNQLSNKIRREPHYAAALSYTRKRVIGELDRVSRRIKKCRREQRDVGGSVESAQG